MKIGVHGKEFTRQSAQFIQHIFEILTKHHADLFVSIKFAKFLNQSSFKKFKWETYEPTDSLKNLQLLISIGGDGTLLESVSYIGKTEIPVLGINTGRLGFLATISREETDRARPDQDQCTQRVQHVPLAEQLVRAVLRRFRPSRLTRRWPRNRPPISPSSR